MSIENLIKQTIIDELDLAINSLQNDLAQKIAECISKPEYLKWGRFLTTRQAMKYLGCKSSNGLKSLLRRHNIVGYKSNSKTVKYDRHELDRVNVNLAIEAYTTTLL